MHLVSQFYLSPCNEAGSSVLSRSTAPWPLAASFVSLQTPWTQLSTSDRIVCLWPLTALITAAGVSFSQKGMLCHNPPILLLLSYFSPLSLFLMALLTFHRFYPQFSFRLADFFPLIYTTYDPSISSFLNSSSSSLSYLQKWCYFFLLLNYLHSQSFHLRHLK